LHNFTPKLCCQAFGNDAAIAFGRLYAKARNWRYHLPTHWDFLTAMTTTKLNKPFSMIREFHLADWFTLANAVCGTGALFSMMTYLQSTDVRHVYFACWLVVAALVFDVLDGRIARWRQKTSAMGRELDSLADIISFGITPAVIAYGCGMQGLYDRIVLAYFVACGVSRLARYNITADALSEGTGKVTYFEGTPIPTSLLLVVLMFVAALQGALGESLWFGQRVIAGFTLHPLVLVFALSGSLMVSRIRFPKL
jgi:CDP-diacylglycerol--serine O-phosphatidyltransferase